MACWWRKWAGELKQTRWQTVSAVLRRRDRVQRQRVIDSQYVCVCLPIRAGLGLQQRHCNCLDCQTSQRSSCHCCWLDQRAFCLSVSLSPLHMQNFRIWFFFIANPSNSLIISYPPVCLDVCQSLSLFLFFLTSVHCGMFSGFYRSISQAQCEVFASNTYYIAFNPPHDSSTSPVLLPSTQNKYHG